MLVNELVLDENPLISNAELIAKSRYPRNPLPMVKAKSHINAYVDVSQVHLLFFILPSMISCIFI